MNPILLYLASGESLYAGSLLLLATIALTWRCKNPWLLRLRNLLEWLALAMILLACPPVPLWSYALLFTAALAWFIVDNNARWRSRPAIKRPAALLAIVPILTLCILEWPHRQLPTLPAAHPDRVCVIGDSISAGIDSHPPWPKIYAQTYHTEVLNLSRPGIGTEEAAALAAKLPPAPAIVLVEIGGNDLLGSLPSAQFEQNLTTLLDHAQAPNRILIMIELPLLPHLTEYGRIQRRLAQTYHVLLIPKRKFIEVLVTADATSDGLHLSPTGARSMAELIHQVCSSPSHP